MASRQKRSLQCSSLMDARSPVSRLKAHRIVYPGQEYDHQGVRDDFARISLQGIRVLGKSCWVYT